MGQLLVSTILGNWLVFELFVCLSLQSGSFCCSTSGGLKNYESDAGLVAGQVYDIVVTYDNNFPIFTSMV